jgi:DNA (cytosine-5)-methyltransferase 1
LSGVTFRKRKKLRQQENQRGQPKKGFTKATTTALVRSIFENFFPDQIEIKDKKGPKKKRCGVCDACQAPDCGKCANCKDMIKFGGTGRGKQACKLRRCPNMAIEDAELSENENEAEDIKETVKKKKVCSKRSVSSVQWCGEKILESKGRQFYESAMVGEINTRVGDYVMLNSENSEEPLCVAKIVYMYDRFPQGPTIHVHMFHRGIDTILGETADPQELFVANLCEDCPLGSVIRKAEVVFKETPKNWFELGGTEILPLSEGEGHVFHFSKQYNSTTATFTDYAEEKHVDGIDSCNYCWIAVQKKKLETPLFEEDAVQWRGDTYQVGSAVFLDSSAYTFSSTIFESSDSVKNVDETIYVEYYRKTADIKGSNQDTPEPFCIGQIEDIWEKNKDVKLKVRIFFRPENTKNSVFLAHQSDVNLVYWTEEGMQYNFSFFSITYVMFYDIKYHITVCPFSDNS